MSTEKVSLKLLTERLRVLEFDGAWCGDASVVDDDV
jgi:hypothetical protein